MMNSDKLPFTSEGISSSESLLLELLRGCSGKIKGRTKLMKLVFFSEYYDPLTESLQPDERIGGFDDFIIYNYGPFSKKVMQVFDELKDKDLIEEDTELTFSGDRMKIIRLTKKGKSKLEDTDELEKSVDCIIDEFGHKKASQLEDESLSRIGISRSEKDDYRHEPVSDIISS